jgi:cell division septum initiation protein DivIVA
MEKLKELKTKLQNLLDVQGADLELVLPDAIDLVNDIEDEFDEFEDNERIQKERIDELETELKDMEEAEGSEVCEINTGRDTLYIRSDSGNLLDIQIIEALKEAMESNKVKPTHLLETLQALTK